MFLPPVFQVMKRRSGIRPCAAFRAALIQAAMKQRTRKAIGTFSVVLFIIVYALVMMAVGGEFAVGKGMAVELLFYVVAGALWLPVVMVIIRWMSKPDRA